MRARLDLERTQALARKLAQGLCPGDVIGLSGSLGAGKTTFVRFLLRGLGVEEEIPSPTFNLVFTYASSLGTIWHFDLFRLDRPEEAYELGIEEAFADGISLIEWPERLGELLPSERLEITLESDDERDHRWLSWRAAGRRAEALAKRLAAAG